MIEAVDDCLGEQGEIIVLGSDVTEGEDSPAVSYVSLSVRQFIEGTFRMYGAHDSAAVPQIPSASGPLSIPIDRLRNLQEDLDILHSEILSEETKNPDSDDSFWRGAPPTWSVLHAGADIVRSIHTDVVKALEEALGENKNRTIELRHSPGAGGTTVALRAAWELHRSYPVAVLRQTSRLTLDRIDQFFQLSQRTVLIVVDASVMAPSAREDLYRGLVNRNSRAVILYVVRTNNTDKGRSLSVFDPMVQDEANRFLECYSGRTKNATRKKSLEKITTSSDPQWQRYRSPFFYGLFTYERDFQSLDRFVKFHLREIGYRARQAMLYLALVTRFTQAWLDESILFSILGLPGDSSLNLEQVLGEGPARLVVRNERQRKLLHPLIAEEALRELLGGREGDAWKDGIKDLAIDFIGDIVTLVGAESIEANHLFVQLFILRDAWYEQQTKGRPKFAELVAAIRSAEGQHQVLAELTRLCPHEAHYWNHLGRHHFYELRSDFAQAEKYLERAIELSPDDSYHHHSLGMVRRIWVEDSLANAFKSDQIPTSDDLLTMVEDLVQRAAENFSKARELSPEGEHGYVTHSQMIIHVAERLLRASGVNDLARISGRHGRTAAWLQKNIVIAEDLIARLQHLRGQAQPSRYELTCMSRLSGIYGNYDVVIEKWEHMLAGRSGGEDLRRAIASAYYSRRKRIWSGLPDQELRRVVELMESNLREDPANSRDVRMWFQAYRRLPEFSQLEALDRLEAWAGRDDALDANFYLYILHYLRLREGKSQSEERALSSLDRCRQGARGKRGHSYEWLGNKPDWCPLVHHSDLGTWNKKIDFYPDVSLLARVAGTIETIKGPKSGTIRLGRVFRAFFVPGTRQWESKDINAVVHFYLGFSYDGPRAWSVELAHGSVIATAEPGLIRGAGQVAGLANVAPMVQGVSPRREVIDTVLDSPGNRSAAIAEKAKATSEVVPISPLDQAVRSFILREIKRSKGWGQKLFVATLESRLREAFPGEPVHRRLGHSKLQDLLAAIDEVTVSGKAPGEFVSRA